MRSKRFICGAFVLGTALFAASPFCDFAAAGITANVLFQAQPAPGYNGYALDFVVGNVAVGLASGTATGGATDAALFTSGSMINLSPSGYGGSEAISASIDGYEVGHGYQSGSTVSQPLLWNGSANSYVDLSPAGLQEGSALGVFGTQQVGVVTTSATNGEPHAVLWSSSAASMMDLNPNNSTESQANATDGAQQVGFAVLSGLPCAILWNGASNSFTNLNPAGYQGSTAAGIGGGQQVGMGEIDSSTGFHAMVWSGTAASAVNLDPTSTYFQSEALATTGSNQVGFVQPAGGLDQAVLWSGTANSMINLQSYLPSNMNWYSSEADYISSDGTIYGSAISDGGEYAVMWSLPEPNELGVLFLFGAMLHRKWRLQKP